MVAKRHHAKITDLLMRWYSNNKRTLPWRDTDDPYSIWVSEVMLQQTQVSTVIDYYHRFIQMFPTIENLADAPQEHVLKQWEGLGYYARARNLHKAAGIITSRYKGDIPDDWPSFIELPGVGDYIASAVLSIAFGQPHVTVDGNVKRVLARLYKIDMPVNHASASKKFKDIGQRLLNLKDPGTFNQALMEFGALVCKPKQPDCIVCPLKSYCQAYDSGVVAEFPKRKSKKPIPHRKLVAGVIIRNKKVLIVQRPSDQMLGGLWEFPGGEVKAGETSRQACKNRIRQQTCIKVTPSSRLTQIRHAYSHFTIQMDVFSCNFQSGNIQMNGPSAYKWIRIQDLDQYPFHGAVHKFLPLVKEL